MTQVLVAGGEPGMESPGGGEATGGVSSIHDAMATVPTYEAVTLAVLISSRAFQPWWVGDEEGRGEVFTSMSL